MRLHHSGPIVTHSVILGRECVPMLTSRFIIFSIFLVISPFLLYQEEHKKHEATRTALLKTPMFKDVISEFRMNEFRIRNYFFTESVAKHWNRLARQVIVISPGDI